MSYSKFTDNYEYPDGYLRLLTEAEAEILKTDYLAYVANNPNDICPIFINEGKVLGGYEISLNDYYFIMSFPGVQQWIIRFGYSHDRGLQLIISGKTFGGIKMTPNILLTNPYALDTTINTEQTTKNFEVPVGLYDSWLHAYKNLLGREVPSSFLQSPFNSGNTLRGYTFDFSDFLDELYHDGMPIPGDAILNFNIVNHAMPVYGEAPAQTSIPGMIGIAVCAKIPNKNDIRYYDISAPCPPTCP